MGKGLPRARRCAGAGRCGSSTRWGLGPVHFPCEKTQDLGLKPRPARLRSRCSLCQFPPNAASAPLREEGVGPAGPRRPHRQTPALIKAPAHSAGVQVLLTSK